MKKILINKALLEDAKINFSYGVRCSDCGKIIFANSEYEREILVESCNGEYDFYCEDCMEEIKEYSEYKTYECHLASGQLEIYTDNKIIAI